MTKSIFGAIKSALFETDTEQATESNQTAPAATGEAPAPQASINASGGAGEMAQRLTDLVMSKPTAYSRLLQAAERLQSFIPDEAARFKGAISVEADFKAQDVLSAIDKDHLGALDQQLAAFNAQSAQHMAQEVDSRMQSIEATKAQVQARAQQADQLRQELASKLAELARLDEADNKLIIETLRDADAKRSEIESVQARFQAAADQVRSQLLQMREKLSRYLAA